jgi:next-to-BRCA1 protein 1
LSLPDSPAFPIPQQTPMDIDGLAYPTQGFHQNSPAQESENITDFWNKGHLARAQVLSGPQRLLHQPQQPQISRTMSTTSSCCSVSQGKAEIQSLLTTFKSDLDCIMNDTFGSSTGNFAPPLLPNPPTVAPTVPGGWPEPLPSWATGAANFPDVVPIEEATRPCVNMWCMVCGKLFGGPWYSCDKCSWHVLVRYGTCVLAKDHSNAAYHAVVPQLCEWPWRRAWTQFRRRTHHE